jgi:hypothetical protein
MTRKRLALVLVAFAVVMGAQAARVVHADETLLRLMSTR